ncbi:MAG TPA: hypothetical protein VIM64_05070 [Puia sp.]
MKKVLFITRQSLIFILLLQLLNLSICSEAYLSCSRFSRHDPTETIVEWVVEWKKGNQDAFTYTGNINLKGLNKSFSWSLDVQHSFPPAMTQWKISRVQPLETTSQQPSSGCIDILSPPPEC